MRLPLLVRYFGPVGLQVIQVRHRAVVAVAR